MCVYVVKISRQKTEGVIGKEHLLGNSNPGKAAHPFAIGDTQSDKDPGKKNSTTTILAGNLQIQQLFATYPEKVNSY